MIEAILDHWMIESTTDFWIFIGGFFAIGAAVLGVVWFAIRRIFKGKEK